MATGWLSKLTSSLGLSTARVAAKPFSEQGVAGFSAYGGYVSAPEVNPDVAGPNRWHTAQDILTNISIVAASIRFSLNLISGPSWRADPPSDKQEAKDMAEFVEEVMNGIDTSWSRIVRRSGMYRYHGFGIHEWVAKKRDDGRIGIASIEPRPVHTIRKWDLDENGGVLGVIQVSPQNGQEIYLPRRKLIYLVDDALTDRPEGMGWFRHLADPAQRLRRYLKLETMGFERDLAGIPVGRAPLQRINQLVNEGKLTQKQADQMIAALDNFVRIKMKEPDTGLVLDSEPFRAKTETGETISSVMQWGMELITGSATSVAALGQSVSRLTTEMAMIIGTESMLVGQKGEGSRALSEDKSRNLYLTCNAALTDMAEAFDRDVVTTLWTMNGLPDELRPKLRTEDVAFKDVAIIAKAIADMAAAGAVLHPNDPAINDLRDAMGVSHAPPVDEDTADLMLGSKAGLRPPDPNGGSDPNQTGRPSRENPGSPGEKPGDQKKPVDKAAPRTMYVQRKLLNAKDLIAWAKAQGFETTTPPDDMHVTQAFSRAPVDWMTMGNAGGGDPGGGVTVPAGGPRLVEPLGDKGAVVLLFRSGALETRHADMLEQGASWDYPEYQPHVTVTYNGEGVDLSKVEPYTGELRFGPEIFSEVDDDWSSNLTEKRKRER